MLPHQSFDTSDQLYSRYYSDAISRSFITNVIRTMRPPAFGLYYSTAAASVVSALQEIANGANVKQRLTRLTAEVKAIYHQG